MTKICIITPVYNTKPSVLKRCLYLLMDNSFEVIIVDDCSDDLNTIKVLNTYETYNNFHILKNPINLGPGESRRAAIEYIIQKDFFGAKYFGFVDSDDIINTGEYLKFLEETKKAKAKIGIARVKCYLGKMPIGFKSKSYGNKKIDLDENTYMLKSSPSLLTCRIFEISLAKLFNTKYVAKVYEDTERRRTIELNRKDPCGPFLFYLLLEDCLMKKLLHYLYNMPV